MRPPRTPPRVNNPPSEIVGLGRGGKRRHLQRSRRLQTVTGGADPLLAHDGQPYTHWIVDFDSSALTEDKPHLNLVFDDPVQVTHYTIMSGNAHPQQDPKSWQVWCRRHEDPSGDWAQVDSKADQFFESRHETQTFQMTPEGNEFPKCDELSWVFTDVKDPQYQGGAGIDINGAGTTDNQVATFT